MSWIITHFVNPGMLAGLALVAAPIVIWLFNRVRVRQVEWAAQVFLLRAMKRSQRRRNIENLLLLLLRCLVLACFVLAIARPRGTPIVPINETEARRNVVLLLDTSWSTGYQTGSDAKQTVHEREKRAAKDIIRQLRPVDRLSIIAFDEQARKVYATPRSVDARTQREVLDEIDSLAEMQVSARGTDYGAAFALLPEVLGRFDAGPDGSPRPPEVKPNPKTVFLLTDNQRSGLAAAKGLKARLADDIKNEAATIFVVDCSAEEPKNAGIVTLETREPIVGTNMPCYIECAVRNFGMVAPGAKGAKGESLSGLTLQYFVDGSDSPVKEVTLDLAPEETRQLEPLRYVFHDKGAHRVRVALRSDALQMDNERTLVVDVRDAVPVLLVDGDPRPGKWDSETDFLARALDPEGLGKELIQPEVIQEPALPVGALRKYGLIVMANVASVPDEHVAALSQYVREGGALLFTMGALIDREHYNTKLWQGGQGVFPCQLGDVKGPTMTERAGSRDPNAPEWVFALANADHPIVGIFAEEDMKPVLRDPNMAVFHYIEAKDLTIGKDKDGKPLHAKAPLRFVPRPKEDRNGEAAKPTDPKMEEILEGAPALVEKPYGRGRSLAYLTSVGFHREAEWTNTIMYPMYLALWRRTALEMARSAQPKRNLGIGDRFERIID
ncbi:MAG: BatA domain-containing protein, partial [Planctomycetota bacterium]